MCCVEKQIRKTYLKKKKTMSDPFSSLDGGKDNRKNPRIPLGPSQSGKRPIPFRRQKPEEVMFKQMYTNAPRASPGLGRRTPRNAPGGNKSNMDLDLLSAMTNRLTKAEGNLIDARAEINRQEGTIKQLTDQIRHLERERRVEPVKPGYHERQCARFQRRIHEMESFLADYGMIWVGEDEEDEPEEFWTNPDLNTDSDEVEDISGSDSDTFNVNYAKILSNIQELNVLAGEGVGQVARRADGARHIKMPDAVPIRLYKNGVLMFEGPFRSFDDISTKQLIIDLQDGYFPSELQTRYPDGIPFKVFDCQHEDYTSKKTHESFHGQGRHLTKPSSNIHGVSDLGHQETVKQVSAESLLNKLPKSVIKNGRVIDIRGGVADLLSVGASGNRVSVLNTDVLDRFKTKLTQFDAETIDEEDEHEKQHVAEPQAEIVTLQVKSEDGKDTYVLKLTSNDTVKTVREHLNKHRSGQSAAYKLVSTYPRKELDDATTLAIAGLVPRATIRMIAKKFNPPAI
eukprot:m.23806 g.23806  ORF g.23806 m.23806 type:complete len:512 (-) comp14365_c0_seq1:166-1701(-)